MSDGDETSTRRVVIDKSKLNRPPDLHLSIDIPPFLRFRNRSRCPTTTINNDPPADKTNLMPRGSTRHAPVVHHATHRCLTPTRKINSGENITRRISWRDNEHVHPTLSLFLRLVSFIVEPGCSCASLGYQGMVGLRGLKQARENERGRGTPIHFFHFNSI